MPKPVMPLWEQVYPRKGQHNTPIQPGDPGQPWQHRSNHPAHKAGNN